MATCKTCTGEFRFKSVCRCCELVDKDKSIKPIQWCALCGVQLCEACWNNPLKRILAFGIDFFSDKK